MVSPIESEDDFEQCISAQLCVILFSDVFAEQCKMIREGFAELIKKKELSHVKFYEIQAESLPKICLQYKIDAVPTTLFFKNKKQIDRVDGADVAEISNKVLKYGNVSVEDQDCATEIEKMLTSLINQHKVMVFMKGDRKTPRCGFSRQLIEILNGTDVEYGTFDILTNELVRQQLKTFSDWPTYPQLYVKGELIGGLDIIKELVNTNELTGILRG
uniref:Putative glutaredoxin-related protein n=1 Tax=Xenopsylla cheopis TaxID=163159 RepID=A0A6M2DCC1_XENCH